MLLHNLEYETTYIDENNKNKAQGPKHIRELSDNIGSHSNTLALLLEKTLLHVYYDFARDFLSFIDLCVLYPIAYQSIEKRKTAFLLYNNRFVTDVQNNRSRIRKTGFGWKSDDISDGRISVIDCTTQIHSSEYNLYFEKKNSK